MHAAVQGLRLLVGQWHRALDCDLEVAETRGLLQLFCGHMHVNTGGCQIARPQIFSRIESGTRTERSQQKFREASFRYPARRCLPAGRSRRYAGVLSRRNEPPRSAPRERPSQAPPKCSGYKDRAALRTFKALFSCLAVTAIARRRYDESPFPRTVEGMAAHERPAEPAATTVSGVRPLARGPSRRSISDPARPPVDSGLGGQRLLSTARRMSPSSHRSLGLIEPSVVLAVLGHVDIHRASSGPRKMRDLHLSIGSREGFKVQYVSR